MIDSDALARRVALAMTERQLRLRGETDMLAAFLGGRDLADVELLPSGSEFLVRFGGGHSFRLPADRVFRQAARYRATMD